MCVQPKENCNYEFVKQQFLNLDIPREKHGSRDSNIQFKTRNDNQDNSNSSVYGQRKNANCQVRISSTEPINDSEIRIIRIHQKRNEGKTIVLKIGLHTSIEAHLTLRVAISKMELW